MTEIKQDTFFEFGGGLKDRADMGLFTAGIRDFPLLRKSQAGSGARSFTHLMVTGGCLSARESGVGVKLTTVFLLVPTSRMCGDKPLLSYRLSWRVKGQSNILQIGDFLQNKPFIASVPRTRLHMYEYGNAD